ncbi:MAG: T9SS type A sorting domain-containing protein [Candidatus Delongbacteria bacterium]|nr:T9SS type A sorting domain-containing protein [Candidatus Delongbacteria bacterium]MBN2833974.1 T9SS type A sorting domain-containing protein [Candidatus Delongbacteria bacterium]
MLTKFILLLTFSTFLLSSTWIHTYGGNEKDDIYGFDFTNDNNILAVGSTKSFSFDNHRKGMLVKVDLNGGTQWLKTYSNGNPYNLTKMVVSNEFIYLGGVVNTNGDQDALLIKTDLEGNIIWEKQFGDSDIQFASCIYLCEDSILLSMECKTSNPYADGKLLILDLDGNLIEDFDFPNQIIRSIIQVDGGFVFCGYETGSVYLYSGLIGKVDNNFQVEWSEIYNEYNDSEYFYDFVVTTEDNRSYFTCVGTANASYINSNTVGIITKVNDDGMKIWSTVFDYSEETNDQITSISTSSDGNFIISGFINFKFNNSADCFGLIAKVDHGGNIIWEKNHNLSIDEFDFFNRVKEVQSSGDLLIVGSVGGNDVLYGNSDGLILRTDSEGNYTDIDENFEKNSDLVITSYPNPFNASTTFTFTSNYLGEAKITVTNTNGQLIDKFIRNITAKGTHSFSFDAVNLHSGIYFVKIEIGSSTSIKKISLIK